MRALCAILLLIASAPAFAQSTSLLEKRAIATAQRVSARKLDPQLPNKPFAVWLAGYMPTDTKFEWESNDCGEQTGDPATTPADPPVCAQVTASKDDNRLAVIMILVGTVKKGITGKPSVFFISADRGGAFQPVKSLHDIVTSH